MIRPFFISLCPFEQFKILRVVESMENLNNFSVALPQE